MSKLSAYNFFIEEGNKIICFNAISRFIFALNKTEFDFLQKSVKNLSLFQQQYPSYFSLLKNKHFIVEKNLNEYNYIRYLNRRDVFSNNHYRLIINPTLECNFKCWYCYETHPRGHISDELEQKIIKHVEHIACKKYVNRLDLSWFGGEPLLYFDKIVYPISKKSKYIFEKNGLGFSNHATTNAYLIDKKMLNKFSEIDLNSFQITIDGIKKEHDKIRNTDYHHLIK
jgi:uncharacterized protein